MLSNQSAERTAQEMQVSEQLLAVTPVESPGASDYAFFDAFLVLVKYRGLIWKIVASAVIGSIVVSLLLPVKYTATAKILPPKENNSLTALMAGAQLGALASLAGSGGLLKDANDTYVSMLKSQTIADSLIQQFDLMKVYRKKTLADTEQRLAEVSSISAGQDSIITVQVEDRDPGRAANIANAYVSGLSKLTVGLLNNSARQRRAYLGERLNNAEDDLSRAELALRTTEERTGLIALNDQAKAIIEGVAKLRAEIAAKQVELESMQSFATAQNPDVVRLKAELTSMRAQLTAMQEGDTAGKGNVFVPTGKVPAAGLQYVDKLREVKFSEALVELIGKQYELALLDESNSISAVQVLDRAAPPQKKSSPKRGLIVFLSTLTAIFVSMALAFFLEHLEHMAADPEGFERLQRLRLLFRKKDVAFKAADRPYSD